MNIGKPSSGQSLWNAISDSKGSVDTTWYRFLMSLRDWITENSQAGPTGSRPTTNLYVGRFYYDTTLGYGVWVNSLNPTVWHSAAGISV